VRGALVGIALLAAACAGPPRGSPPTPAGGPTREVLPNGAVVIVHEHRASEVVALQLWLRVGARDEAPDELGLSHYLEHMLFKGTPTRPPGAIDHLVEGLGGRSNAFTTQDFTHFDLLLPAAHLRTGIELLADVAVNARLDPAELDAEKQVVLEEMRLTEDDSERYLLRRLYEAVYAPHPYGRPILGTPALIRALTRERLHAYYTRYYVPRNMVLVIVGAVDPTEARHLARAAFGRLGGGEGRRPSVPPVPPTDTPRHVDVPRPGRQAYLGLAWRAAATSHADVYAVDLLTYVLGDGPTSRLNRILRERERLVYAIEAGYGAWALGGAVTVTARLDPANLERAERAILEVVRGLQADGVTEAERTRALVTAEATYVFDIETAEGLAKTYGQAETTWTLEDELQYLARLRRVTAGEIQAAARRYLGERYARVRFVPEGGGR